MGKSWGAYMEFMRGKVTNSAPNVYTEEVLSTPASKNEMMAMLIHMVILRTDSPDPIDATQTYVYAGLTRRSRDAFIEINDPDAIYTRIWTRNLGVVEGTLSEYNLETMGHEPIVYFDPPILYAKDALYLSTLGANNTAVKSVYLQLGYTLERVTLEQFVAALTE